MLKRKWTVLCYLLQQRGLINGVLCGCFMLAKRFYNIAAEDLAQAYGYILFGVRTRIKLNALVIGERYIHMGKHCRFGSYLWLAAMVDGEQGRQGTQGIFFGDRVEMNDFIHIGCVNRIEIGNDVLMGSKIYITDHNHGEYKGPSPSSPDEPPADRHLTTGQAIKIGDRVWIGEFVTILPGITIGEGSIIGTHSTVTHDIPPNSIAVGSPARVIKQWNAHTQTWDNVTRK